MELILLLPMFLLIGGLLAAAITYGVGADPSVVAKSIGFAAFGLIVLMLEYLVWITVILPRHPPA